MTNSHVQVPFTIEEQILLDMHQQHENNIGSHHHHHHSPTISYKRPQFSIYVGLYSLMKLDTMKPDLLTSKQKRLLQPVAPGLFTYLFYTGYLSLGSFASIYIYQTNNLKLLSKNYFKTIVPLVVMVASFRQVQKLVSYVRESYYYSQRKLMVDKYVQNYGQKFLLDLLDPNTRLENF